MGWIDFMQHLVAAVTINQFWCEGAGCPTITLPSPAGPQVLPVSAYFSMAVSGTWDDIWRYMGIAIGIMGAIQAAAVAAHVAFNWQKR